jgi:glycolate oxidase FAD binding subunit
LAALEEVTLKVLPRPETEASLMVAAEAPDAASRLMAAALGSPHEVSGAAYLPAGYAPWVPPGGVVLRVEGPEPSVASRSRSLQDELAAGACQILEQKHSAALWKGIGEVLPLTHLDDRAVWRVSVAPSRGAAVAEAVARQLDAAWFLDWGGGLAWLAVPEAGDAGAAIIRNAVSGGGHAMLLKASPGLRRAVPVFEPQPAPLAALSRRVKDAFDPRYILNPGRMVEGA